MNSNDIKAFKEYIEDLGFKTQDVQTKDCLVGYRLITKYNENPFITEHVDVDFFYENNKCFSIGAWYFGVDSTGSKTEIKDNRDLKDIHGFYKNLTDLLLKSKAL